MRIPELIRYSKRLLKGRRINTMFLCLLPVAAELFFRTAEACIYSLLLYFGEMKPLELFSGRDPLQLGIMASFTLLRWTAVAPLSYAAAHRLVQICREDGRITPAADVLTDSRCFRRSIEAALWTKLAGLLALAPAAFFAVTTYSLLFRSQTAGQLFLTVHAAVLTAVSLGLWLALKLSFTAVPFLLAERPGKSPLSIVLYSLRFMSGKRSVLLRLILVYLPAMTTIAAIPAVLPALRTSFALTVHIYTKEEEYLEGNKAHRNVRKAHDSPELPAGQKRRFKTAPDQT